MLRISADLHVLEVLWQCANYQALELLQKCAVSEQQIILGAFGYLTPSTFSHLGKITLLFFSLSNDTLKK